GSGIRDELVSGVQTCALPISAPDPRRAGDKALSDVNRFQKVYYHRLGADQAQDVLVYERPDQPDWGMNAEVTDDGRYAVLHIWQIGRAACRQGGRLRESV